MLGKCAHRKPAQLDFRRFRTYFWSLEFRLYLSHNSCFATFGGRAVGGPPCHNAACFFFEPNSLDLQEAQSIDKNTKTKANILGRGIMWSPHCQGPKSTFPVRHVISCLRGCVSRRKGLWEGPGTGVAGRWAECASRSQSSSFTWQSYWFDPKWVFEALTPLFIAWSWKTANQRGELAGWPAEPRRVWLSHARWQRCHMAAKTTPQCQVVRQPCGPSFSTCRWEKRGTEAFLRLHRSVSEVAQLVTDWVGSKKPDSWFGIFPSFI